MAGPWEKFKSQESASAEESGPWTKFAAQEMATTSAAPGEPSEEAIARANPLSAVIHGGIEGLTSQFGHEIYRALGDEGAVERSKASQAAYPKLYTGSNIIGGVVQAFAAPAVKISKALGTLGFGALSSGLASLGASKKESVSEAVSDTATGLLGGAIMTHAGGKFLSSIGKPIFAPASKEAVKASGLVSLETAKNAASQLTTMAGTGAAANLIMSSPESWQEAMEVAEEGAYAGIGLGLTAKAGIGIVNKVGGIIKRGLLDLRKNEIKIAEAALDDAVSSVDDASARLSQGKLNKDSALTKLTQLEDQSSVIQNQINKVTGVIDNELPIAQQLGDLTDGIDAALKTSLTSEAGIGAQIGQIVKQLPGKLDLADDVKTALDSIKSVKAFTQGTLMAKRAAEKLIKFIDEGAAGTNPTFDPLLNKTVGKLTREYDPNAAWQAKQQIQDLLYNKEFLAGAKGTGLRNILVGFERKLANRLAGMDSTGQLAQYNKAYSAFSSAREKAMDIFSTDFFKKAALKPNDPSVVKALSEFDNLFTKAMSEIDDPVIKAQIQSTRDVIDAQMRSATGNYMALDAAKKSYTKMSDALERAQITKERLLEKLSGLDLTIKESSTAAKSAITRQMRAKNLLEDLRNPDISIPLFGNISEKSRAVKSAIDAAATSAPLKGVGKGLNALNQLPGTAPAAINAANAGLLSLPRDPSTVEE